MNSAKLSKLAFCLFNAWLLSFAYEGQILYAILGARTIESAGMVRSAILAHAAGLFVCGFFEKTPGSAGRLMTIVPAVCLLGSGAFLFPAPSVWLVALPCVSFLAGLWNASWGFACRSFSTAQERMAAVSVCLAGSTMLMAALDLAAVCIHPFAGLIPSLLCLAAACLCARRCSTENAEEKTSRSGASPWKALGRPFLLLCLFIAAVTVTSGLMFQVVNPAFEQLGLLTTLYGNVPYIAAMIAAARLPRSFSRSYLLSAALAMIGLGFLAFMVLDRSVLSYLIVNTLLLGAFGITDLFWWSILGEMLEFHQNPARVMGLGLSVNVAGVLLGETVSGFAKRAGSADLSAAAALASVCAAVVILPVLYSRLTVLLKNGMFLQTLEEMPPEKRRQTIDSLFAAPGLTAREREIAALLLKGYTYRLIARELYISESTVKTHIQNIYCKLDVRSKSELIRQLGKR